MSLYYYRRGADIQGPVSSTELKIKFTGGRLPLGTEIREGTDGPWRSIQSLSDAPVSTGPIVAKRVRSLPWQHKLALLAVAVPLFYILSAPWLDIFWMRAFGFPEAGYRAYFAPIRWLVDKTPLKEPLYGYAGWCRTIAGDPW